MRKLLSTAAVIAPIILASTSMTTAYAGDPVVKFERYKLDNGLEVILHQDNSVPLVAVNVWYHVGSGNEVVGKSGFAHLFEHMLFQGSEHVGEDRHFEVLKTIGATGVNGTTNSDRTNYFEVIPSNQIEVGLWLESDRMGYLLGTVNKKSLDNQIEVVRNERRQRIDNVPYGPSDMKTAEVLYPEGHPYRYSVIGRHQDLTSASVEDVKNFYRKWYVPANATLTLAGDFEINEAKKLVAKWFGSFPKGLKPTTKYPPIPRIDKTIRVEVPDPLAKLRKVSYVWHTPPFYKDGDAELDVLANALGESGTGRLYKILVYDKQLAQSVRVYQDSAQLSSTFHIDVLIKTGADMKLVEQILDQEIERIRREPISTAEFNRALTGIEARMIWGLEGINARANLLQRYNHYLGNPDSIGTDLDRYRKSNPEKVRATAARFLGKQNRAEIVTLPAAKPAAK